MYVQVQGGEPDTAASKKLTMPFRDVECLAFSFKSLACISNLRGLDSLTKLQLDNNHITTIENLGHLVRLHRGCMAGMLPALPQPHAVDVRCGSVGQG
jgi:hypothetical protein